MSVFEIDFGHLVNDQTPVRLRGAVRLAWLAAMADGAEYTHDLFAVNRANDLYDLAHNGQVCYMEAALNDLFDFYLRRIYISNGPYSDAVYIYQDDEDKPVYLAQDSELPVDPADYDAPVYLFTDAETYVNGITFIVNVPVAIRGDGMTGMAAGYTDTRLKALVDRYRMPGKTYTIVSF
jgi:hypothetical protein